MTRLLHPVVLSILVFLAVFTALVVYVDDIRESTADPAISFVTMSLLFGCLMAMSLTGEWREMDWFAAGLMWLFAGLFALFVYISLGYTDAREDREILLTLTRVALSVGALWCFVGVIVRIKRTGRAV